MAAPAQPQHLCKYCETSFTSKNRLFVHLRSSACSSHAAADGLEVGERLEKVALLFGCKDSAPAHWKDVLWEAIDSARGASTKPGVRSFSATKGAPGAAFAFGGEAADGKVLPRALDVVSFSTEIVATEEARAAWCDRVNKALPPDIHVIGRSIGLPNDFHAERSALRHTHVALLPTRLLAPAVDVAGSLPHTSINQRLEGTRVRRKHSKEEHDPGWGDDEQGEELLGQFFRLKEIMRRLIGERKFHNFARSKISPGDAAARRFVYRCKAIPNEELGVTAFTVAADALVPGQLQAMAGLTLAVQHGLLPEDFFDIAFSSDELVQVPSIPLGTHYFAGVIYPKQFHYLIQPVMEGSEAKAWKQQVEQIACERAMDGCFERWFQEELIPKSELLASIKVANVSIPTAIPVASADSGGANRLGQVPQAYTEVLRLLRAAANSGLWPGISRGREKVIKESTLAEHGGTGGSFSVGSMPPPLEAPNGNRLFPELAFRAFELERLVRPDRIPSSTIAINKCAQFLPHVDSGAGAGQGISLIVGLGDYTGGELLVEGVPHDIRYTPTEFNGWTQRHWTAPFEGERFSLVWFTPVGCEDLPGIKVCALNGGLTHNLQSGGESFDAADEPEVLRLRSNVSMPRLGLGTWQLSETSGNAGMASLISAALDSGYRHFDTASIYKNEAVIGQAIRRWEEKWRSEHLDPPPDIFITSKCSPYEMGFDEAQQACKDSLQRLQRPYLDLYLVHWPALPKKPHGSPEHRIARHATWRALEALYATGLVRAIGVSNFTDEHLQQLIDDGVKEMPMVNQIEAHPFFLPRDTISFCEKHGIVIEAYSPLGGGPASNVAKSSHGAVNGTRMLIEHRVVNDIALRLGRSPAQVVLRWGLQRGFAVIPRTCNPQRIVENSQIFNFSLSNLDLKLIDSLQQDEGAQKFCWNSSTVA